MDSDESFKSLNNKTCLNRGASQLKICLRVQLMCEVTTYIPAHIWEYIWGFDGTVFAFQKYRLISKEVYALPWKELLQGILFLMHIELNDDYDLSYVSRINLGDRWHGTVLRADFMQDSNWKCIKNMNEIGISWFSITEESFVQLGRNNPHLEKLRLHCVTLQFSFTVAMTDGLPNCV